MIDSVGLYQISGNTYDLYTGVIDGGSFTDVIEVRKDSNGNLEVYFGAGIIPSSVDKIRKDLTIKKVEINGYINGEHFRKYVA